MVVAGAAKYDVLPGEWFGPNSSCQVIRDLMEMRFANSRKHKRDTRGNNDHGNNNEDERFEASCSNDVCDLRVYVATGGTVYKSDLTNLMTTNKEKETKEEVEAPKNDCHINGREYSDPLTVDHPLSDSFHAIYEAQSMEEEWDASLLILIPLRLGLKKFDAVNYKVPLAHMLSLPQSVGFLGGSPRHALWFYGATSNGEKVYGLDPHTVQRAPRRRVLTKSELEHSTCHKKRYEILLTDEYLRYINCPYTSTMDMTKIDPSLALGFYCRDHQDFKSLCSLLKSAKEDADFGNDELKKFHELFTIADKKPDYAADVSSAMLDLMMNGSPQHSRIGGIDGDDDDDDYVLL